MFIFSRLKLKATLAVLSTAFIFSCYAKESVAVSTSDNNKVKVELGCVAFYNLENMFDTINGPNNDEEYLPNGPMKWGTMKYNAKLKNMSYAISQIGLDKSPVGVMLIGVSEVENRGVLEDLVKQPSLADRTYQIVHYDSPDRRGIDVGLLYNPRYFTLVSSKPYHLYLPNDTAFRTRDQLLVSGYLLGEKIHVIVNHWPSRLGGEEYSRPKRDAAAALSKHIADSIFSTDPKAKIIIMGDLNDDPFNESCAKVIGAKKEAKDVQPQEFYNVFWKTLDKGIGTLAYKGNWDLFDQFMISYELVNGDKSKLHLWKSEVFNKSFLTQQEGAYKGTPLRTHASGVWLNGYSDHYPTLIYLIKELNQ